VYIKARYQRVMQVLVLIHEAFSMIFPTTC